MRSGTPKTMPVSHVESAITVDGVLDEPAWQGTATIGALVQQEPQPGEAPTERTDVRLLHDSDYLYVAVICYFERLFEPFEISDGVVLQPGDYRFTRWRLVRTKTCDSRSSKPSSRPSFNIRFGSDSIASAG